MSTEQSACSWSIRVQNAPGGIVAMIPTNQQRARTWLPLPRGESRGEGEQCFRTIPECTSLHCNARLPGTRGSSSLAHSPQSQSSGHRGNLRQIALNCGKKSVLHFAAQSLHVLCFFAAIKNLRPLCVLCESGAHVNTRENTPTAFSRITHHASRITIFSRLSNSILSVPS